MTAPVGSASAKPCAASATRRAWAVLSDSTCVIVVGVLTVRAATIEDALAVETVRVETWRVAYRGLLPDVFLDDLVVDADRRAAALADGTVGTWLALLDEQPVGMGAAGPSRDGLPGRELYALYVLPAHWGTGAGAALLAACGDVTSLWVLEGNERARAFYTRQGFVPDGTAQQLDLGEAVTEVRLVR